MTATTALPADAAAYLAGVRDALDDLPEAERDDLLAEVEDSLLEAAGEGGSIAARLGPPGEFAAELRTAAGLLPPALPSRERDFVRRATVFVARIPAHPRYAAVRGFASDLAPIWWILRAYLAVALLAVVFDTGWSTRYSVVPRFDSAKFGLALVLAAMIVSVWLGLRARRRETRYPALVAAVNAAFVLAAVPVALELADTSAYDALVAAAYAPTPEPAVQLTYGGVSVDNVYPYSRDGRLLQDVLLYDGAGRPLDIGGLGDPQRRLLETEDGTPIFNSFPIRYFEPGTSLVADPAAGPPIAVPEIQTPPIRVR